MVAPLSLSELQHGDSAANNPRLEDTFNWLFYDCDIELFGCSSCHLAFSTADGVRSHIKSKHSPHDSSFALPIEYCRKIKKKPPAVSSISSQECDKGDAVSPDWATIYKAAPLKSAVLHKTVLNAVPWLAVHDGFQCALCRFCHRTHIAIEAHMQKEHSIEWKSRTVVLRMQVTPKLVQTLLIGNKAKYFPVALRRSSTYWFTGVVRGSKTPGQAAHRGGLDGAAGPPLASKKTFDEISKLCDDDSLDGPSTIGAIFHDLYQANTPLSTSQDTSACVNEDQEEMGFRSSRTHSAFLALTRFDLILQRCGFTSFEKVPTELFARKCHITQDCSFNTLEQDIFDYLEACGRHVYDSAPYIRDIVQLTGYGGSNLRKFKPVELSTLKKYCTYLSSIIVVVLRTFSQSTASALRERGLKLFPAGAISNYERLTNAYLASFSKPRPEPRRWPELSELFAALLIVCIPGHQSTENLPIRQILAVLSVSKAEETCSESQTKYFSDVEVGEQDHRSGAGIGRFKSGAEMSHLLASILYCASCTSVYIIRCGSPERASKVDFVKKSLSLNENTAVAIVRDLLDKTTSDRNADSSPIRFSLCLTRNHENQACGLIDGKHLSFSEVRDGLLKIEDEMKNLLSRDMLLTLPVDLGAESGILRNLRDRHTEPRVGYSFMETPENKDMSESLSRALLQHIMQGTAHSGEWAVDTKHVSVGTRIRSLFMNPSGEPGEAGAVLNIGEESFMARTVRYYLQKCQRFLQLLLVYTHITGGGPPRCTEVCGTRYKNGAFDKRNCYVDQGLFCLLHRYNKNRNLLEKEVNIARFLPRSVSEMLLLYLLYVRPVENMFSRALVREECTVRRAPKKSGGAAADEEDASKQVRDREQRQNEFLYASLGDVYSASKIRDILSREFKQLGLDLNSSQWRQYQNGMEREYMKLMVGPDGASGNATVEGEHHDSDCPYISVRIYSGCSEAKGDPTQAGHSRHRADMNYARTDQVPRGIPYSKYMRHRTNSVLWHHLLGICCNKRRDQQIRECEPMCTTKAETVTPDITELARSVAHEIISLLPKKRANEFHAPVNSEEDGPIVKKRRVHFCLDANRDCSEGSCRHRELALYQEFIPYLREMTSNPNAEFRSRYQLCVLATALQRKRDMLVILATGSGKTLLYLLVAFVEAERARKSRSPTPLTIVIVPTRALVQDMLKRCKEMRVGAVRWNDRESSAEFHDASIIILAVEQVLVSEYAPFLEKLTAEGRLARIVSEECHLMTQWEHFRPGLNQIRHHIFGNSSTPIPIMMASATVSPTLEKSVIDAHAVDVSRLSVIREPTHRDNISYEVQFTSRGSGKKKGAKGKQTEVDKMADIVIDTIFNTKLSGDGESQPMDQAATAATAATAAPTMGVSQVPRRIPEDLRVIIYCPTKDICRKVRGLIGTHASTAGLNWRCALYTADMQIQDKDAVFDFWVKGDQTVIEAADTRESEAFFVAKVRGARTRIVVATSAFGTGIDVPNVRLVFHIGFCRGLYGFAQESGRAGRDGRQSRSVVVYSHSFLDGYVYGLRDRALKNTGTEESVELASIMEFRSWATQFKRCRRQLLFGSLDCVSPPSCLVSKYRNREIAVCDCCQLVDAMARAGIIDNPEKSSPISHNCSSNGDGDTCDGTSVAVDTSAASGENAEITDGGVASDSTFGASAAALAAAVMEDYPKIMESAHNVKTGFVQDEDHVAGIPYRNNFRARYPEKGDRKGSHEGASPQKKMEIFMQMARKLKGSCAICLVKHLRLHSGRESCLASDACFNCFATGMTHNLKECPLSFNSLLQMPDPSCSACGLNMCMGRRLHKRTEWNWRNSCPYRAIVEMFIVAWWTPAVRPDLCEKLDHARIYVLPESCGAITDEQLQVELQRFLRCVLQTLPGQPLPNIVEATECLFDTIGYDFTL